MKAALLSYSGIRRSWQKTICMVAVHERRRLFNLFKHVSSPSSRCSAHPALVLPLVRDMLLTQYIPEYIPSNILPIYSPPLYKYILGRPITLLVPLQQESVLQCSRCRESLTIMSFLLPILSFHEYWLGGCHDPWAQNHISPVSAMPNEKWERVKVLGTLFCIHHCRGPERPGLRLEAKATTSFSSVSIPAPIWRFIPLLATL